MGGLKKDYCFLEFPLDFLSNCIHNVYVDVIGRLKLQGFWEQHPKARRPLGRWLKTAESAKWRNFAQIKQTFGNADLVPVNNRRFVVFNIGGNKYRLVTTVNYQGQIVIVEIALTHAEYDKVKWKD